MTKRYHSVSIEERNQLILWASSAAKCWLVVSAGAAVASVAHLIHLM